ncbi:hypothetical protein [Burkholderia phage BCSR5]|nr:hypothetical protein [Burkholderia phage BCSR5]
MNSTAAQQMINAIKGDPMLDVARHAANMTNSIKQSRGVGRVKKTPDHPRFRLTTIVGHRSWCEVAQQEGYTIKYCNITEYYLATDAAGEPRGAFPSWRAAYRNLTKDNPRAVMYRIRKGWLDVVIGW